MGTDALSKEPIQVEAKSAKQERRTSNILKLRIQYRGWCPRDPEFVIPNWYREFEIEDKTTLEQLATIILQILGWSEDHLYEFKIKHCHYVNFGNDDDDYVVDAKGACVSCAIPMHLIDFNRGDPFEFMFDFAELHTFRLTVVAKYPVTLKRSSIPRVLSCRGKNILQYPGVLSRQAARDARSRQPTVGDPGRPKNRWRIRFVRQEDKRQLVGWRESNDKRLWQKAVTVLDNRSLIPEEIAKKVELPVDVIRGWITTYNRRGLAGLNPPRKKRSLGKKGAALERKRKMVLGLIHSRPQAFGINRTSWNRASLASAYKQCYGEAISVSTIGRIVQKAGYKIKKARRVLSSPDPEYREKVDLVLRTLRNLQPNEFFFFIDELGPLRVKKYGGRRFVHEKDVATVPQEQPNKGSITMSGALNATKNQVSWLYSSAKDTQAMIDLIEILFNQHPFTSRIYLTWDAASWHKSGFLVEWLDAFNVETSSSGFGPIVHLVPLPTSSQFLDVIEAVFSGMKKAVIHHSDYQSEDEMKTAISRHFVERNGYFRDNPKRAGKKIWEIDFFQDMESLNSGNYREW
jgi:transposase